MKIEFTDGRLIAIPETEGELRALLRMNGSSKESQIVVRGKRNHRKYKRLSCSECGKEFKKNGLKIHMHKAHKAQKGQQQNLV